MHSRSLGPIGGVVVDFSRGATLGPTGKLTNPVRTYVDDETNALFAQQIKARNLCPSTVLRDFVFFVARGKTHSDMVRDLEKSKQDDFFKQCSIESFCKPTEPGQEDDDERAAA